MNKSPKRSHIGYKVTALVLLALLCVGGVELAACSYFAPDLYETITAPVKAAALRSVELAETALDHVQQGADKLSSYCSKLLASAKQEEVQKAEDPALKTEQLVCDPAVTAFAWADGKSYLTGGAFPVVYFNQADPLWANQPYGTDEIEGYGCGPTAMAMAVSSLTNTESDPAQMAQWAYDHGQWAKRSGSYLSLVDTVAQSYGLLSESLSERTPEALIRELLNGKLIVALMGPGHFTKSGHFILLRGVTLTGSILVADPNSVDRSLMEWDPQLILDELSTSTANGAPLWTLAAVEE